ncbi:MAG: AMP-binding protein [Solirubrobacteraceae bacterium]
MTLPKGITQPLSRLGAAAQTALEVARFGGLVTDEDPSPYEIAAEHPVYRLRHYYPGSDLDDGSSPIVLVPPMMLAAGVYDVSAATSAVTLLHERGIDPWVVDFGSPEHERGGLERTLADHVRAISDAVDRVRELTDSDVHLCGYSQGGMFVYQVAAYRRNAGLASLITFGSSVDTRAGTPFGLPESFASGAAGLLGDRLFRGRQLPAWASRTGFQLLDPVKSARNRLEFISLLHDRDALVAREGQRRFLESDGWVAWPGPAMADFLRQFIAHNRLLEGGFTVDDQLLTLADISTPILSVIGTVDEIAPAAGVRAISQAAPRADIYELAIRAGHFGLVVGSLSNQVTWPTVAGWVRWRDGTGERPEAVVPAPEDPRAQLEPETGHNPVTHGIELAGEVGSEVARTIVATASRTARNVTELSREAASQLPRIIRSEQLGPRTRISLGLLVAERAQRDPDELLFLFDDRAYTAREVDRRIDNVVRGLISIGVRQGEHVGVLMGPRPSGLAVLAALSRLGAVAVLLRPDGNTRREATLGQVRRVIADPERAAQATGEGSVHTFVLGGGEGSRDFGVEVTTDMEQIDPAAVRLPAWYSPNPGRAPDLAFVLFTGEGENTRMSRITNGRWVTSALGTASSAGLTNADTVYSVTPLHHPSGLMMSIGGAIAGGARVAVARHFDPATFWEEVRRYGVTVASYTWTMLHELADAPPQPGERHHPIRLFMGSGMPRNLWRRVEQRFEPARVLEFYASTETGAILVNLGNAKPGAMGRRLPGSPEVRLGAYDADNDQLVLGAGGFVRRGEPGQPGVLLARAREIDTIATTPLRGVFAKDDSWLSTGDIFRQDDDGDYWRLDGATDVIRTAQGAVYTAPIREALGELPAVDLAVAYGIRLGDGRSQLAVAAVTLRDDRTLDPRTLTNAMRVLPAVQRPAIVHVLDELPVTAWFRPMTGALRAAGLPSAGDRAFYLDAGGERYRPLTAAARKRLAANRR